MQPDYPERLRRIADPPVLYLRGALPAVDLIAIVGARAATIAGCSRARRLAQQLVRGGYGVVSGGALGIDAAAHAGALEARGYTMAVMGTGIDQLYPARNAELLESVARRGALLTPFALETPPRRCNFPQRNRLIAALALAVLVVEAGARSGALNTARHARALGVRLLACPGSVGTSALLGGGAEPVASDDELLAALAGDAVRKTPPDDPDEVALLEHLDAPRSIGELARCSGLSPARVSMALIRLELAGRATPAGAGRYVSSAARGPAASG